MTLKVVRWMRCFLHTLPRSFVQHFSRFQMTQCIARFLRDSWTSCFNTRRWRGCWCRGRSRRRQSRYALPAWLSFDLLQRYAMLARYMLWLCVCLSHCVCVCLSHVGVLLKWQNAGWRQTSPHDSRRTILLIATVWGCVSKHSLLNYSRLPHSVACLITISVVTARRYASTV